MRAAAPAERAAPLARPGLPGPVASRPFRVASPFEPAGDQQAAIEALTCGLERGDPHQVLLGVTGSGKTYTVAKVIEAVNRPALVIAHNKTLAAQLYQEFRQFLPDNAVEYFVSYYDYYQPEAYVPASDTYIEKEATINDEIDRLRLSATRSLFERNDVLIVASVSCIYGLGSPEAYYGMLVVFEDGAEFPSRKALLAKLVEMQYFRNDASLERGRFRVRGDTLEIVPGYEDIGLRVRLYGDEVERIARFDPLTGRELSVEHRATLFPRTHYVAAEEDLRRALVTIHAELDERHPELLRREKRLEAQRLMQRTRFDLDMLAETGHCHGIENYSRHFTGRAPGEPPPTLMDYLPRNTVVIVDESHQTFPQIRGMYAGDQARKRVLVEHGFRLPSALDNRPLNFGEWEQRIGQVIAVSATPGPYELEAVGGEVVEQIIRPTGLLDPEVEVRPAGNQVDDLLEDIRVTVARGERVLVTTLTKRMAEDLAEYLHELDIRCRYLHSDIDTLERVRLLRSLRLGEFDVLVGINLLREGLDLPEVSLVAILDADREGYLRSEGALIQTMGRAARNAAGRAVLYADRITGSMDRALAETRRRRTLQEEYNREHGITPTTVVKDVTTDLAAVSRNEEAADEDDWARAVGLLETPPESPEDLEKTIIRLRKEMKKASRELEFERAARIRDHLRELREIALLR